MFSNAHSNKYSNNKFSNNISELSREKFIAGAISGGPDSLALAFLLKCIGIKKNKNIKFYLVDHRLRKNSSSEAKTVRNQLLKFDINCKIIKWSGKKPKSNIQSQARHVRYKLLYKECLKDKVKTLLTAHHLDDLNENFYLRILRGSGLKGLASFNTIKSKYNEKLSIFRPLIQINKKELIYLTNKVFNFYIKDPSNKDEIYKRVKIRQLIEGLEKEGLDQKKINLTLNNLQKANFAFDYYVHKNIISNANFLKNKNAYILKKSFFDNPQEIVMRSLSDLLKKVGKRYYPSRGRSMLVLLKTIHQKDSFKITLGGCIVEKFNNSLIIYKEP